MLWPEPQGQRCLHGLRSQWFLFGRGTGGNGLPHGQVCFFLSRLNTSENYPRTSPSWNSGGNESGLEGNLLYLPPS